MPLLLLWACSPVRHVPQGQMLLDKVTVEVDDNDTLDRATLTTYLRQVPNHKVLGFARLKLGIYNMSGQDTTRWYNRWIQRMGQAPVIYDPALTAQSVRQIRTRLVNNGFLNATVSVDSVPNHAGRRMALTYRIHTGRPHYIDSVAIECADSAIAAVIHDNAAASLLTTGMALDRDLLDAERTRLTQLLHERGYYEFTKDAISYTVDTVAGSLAGDLTLTVNPPRAVTLSTGEQLGDKVHRRYFINRVIFNTAPDAAWCVRDTLDYRGITLVQGPDPYLMPSILAEKCFIVPGQPYKQTDVEDTYRALAQIAILKFINIEMQPVFTVTDNGEQTVWLDACINLSRQKKQTVSVEVEGTNSEGDLGFGLGLNYTNRDLARRGEVLNLKFRTSYESLSGDLDGLINNRYSEYAAEAGLTFPKFKAPFLSQAFKRRSKASTNFALTFNYQERPEYTRFIAGGAWRYLWTTGTAGAMTRRTLDLVDINYVYLPRSTNDFINQIAPDNPLLRYSYENHFIMRMGYIYNYSNKRIPTAKANSFAIQPSVTSFRASGEIAGNLLYAFSNMLGQHRSDGVYKIFGIQYAQYAKAEADIMHTINLTHRQALAMHAGAGVAYPYGNSRMVPFEKRFYAGGANGVRGWSVRTLGPGAYDARNEVTDFINQCGDIRLDLNLEYRFKLFWVFEGALFIDAGNVWTIRNYVTQPGGLFKFDNFYKEIAAAYGAGLRMDFTYFLLRFDLGLKAHNPAKGQEPWPLVHPNWHRDATFHFAVGYPF